MLLFQLLTWKIYFASLDTKRLNWLGTKRFNLLGMERLNWLVKKWFNLLGMKRHNWVGTKPLNWLGTKRFNLQGMKRHSWLGMKPLNRLGTKLTTQLTDYEMTGNRNKILFDAGFWPARECDVISAHFITSRFKGEF